MISGNSGKFFSYRIEWWHTCGIAGAGMTWLRVVQVYGVFNMTFQSGIHDSPARQLFKMNVKIISFPSSLPQFHLPSLASWIWSQFEFCVIICVNLRKNIVSISWSPELTTHVGMTWQLNRPSIWCIQLLLFTTNLAFSGHSIIRYTTQVNVLFVADQAQSNSWTTAACNTTHTVFSRCVPTFVRTTPVPTYNQHPGRHSCGHCAQKMNNF